MNRRFDWPACFQVFSNRPDKSPQYEPRRSRTQQAFQNRAQLRRRPFISLPTRSVSLPVSERPFSALSSAHPRAICHVQTNEISGGFLELESRLFWLDTIPLHEGKAASRAMSAQHPAGCPAYRPPNHLRIFR